MGITTLMPVVGPHPCQEGQVHYHSLHCGGRVQTVGRQSHNARPPPAAQTLETRAAACIHRHKAEGGVGMYIRDSS
jgi:hypothetical protein